MGTIALSFFSCIQMLANCQTRRAAVLAMKSTPECFPCCVQLLQSRMDCLKTLTKMEFSSSADGQEDLRLVSEEASFGSLSVLNILLQMSREEHPELVEKMCEVAEDVALAMEREHAMLKEMDCTRFLDEGGLELLGRAHMCTLFKQKGSVGVMDCLGSIFPSTIGTCLKFANALKMFLNLDGDSDCNRLHREEGLQKY